MANGVVQIVARAERLHLPLSYLTDIDLERHPAVLDGAAAYVDLGHAEYWSRGMRARVEHARAHGTNLAFFGANTMYWRVRLQDRGRVVVGYRDAAALDPVGARHPRLSTHRWRDQPRPDPEGGLTGVDYECFPVDSAYRVVSPHWWGFRGFHVRRGSAFGDLVGVEADRVYPVRPTPKALQVLSYNRYSCGGVPTSTESVYYTVRSGAGVFNAGTLRWSCAMTRACRGAHISPRTKHFVQHVTDRVLLVFSHPRAGRSHPAHRNVARFWLPKVNQVPAS